MDPLSVTLAVVSLTTAVKDMVELGQKIHESFGKVSNNLRNAQHMAADIKEMVEEIRDFCDDNKDSLGNMKDLDSALQDLLAKFRSFETSILPLLPQTGRKRRIFRGWDAWRNSKKVEGSLLALQSNILKVMRGYIVKSAMRTEVKLNSIGQEARSGFTEVRKETRQGLEVLEIVRREVCALRTAAPITPMVDSSYTSSSTSNDEFTRNVTIFAQSVPSTSAPMLRTPNGITEELLTNAYIKLQLDSVEMTLAKISALPVSTSNSIRKFRFAWPVQLQSMNITRIRHHAVRLVLGVRDLFGERIESTSLYDGADALNTLSVWLRALNMRQECDLVGNWAVTLIRTLVDAPNGRHPDHSSSLALYLLNRSIRAWDGGDLVEGLQSIEEAHIITQNLRNQHSSRVQFQILHGEVLLQYAKFVDIQMSIKMCIEAVQVLEESFNVRMPSLSGSAEETQVTRRFSCFVDGLFSSTPPTTAIMTYTHALQKLATYLVEDGHYKSALGLALLAIAVHRKMVSLHGSEYTVYLATALISLVQRGTISCIPAEELIDMADECLPLLRKLAQENPLFYARKLVFALWAKGRTLERLTRDAEATAAYDESVGLARKILEDSELRAAALDHLSKHFRRLRRHDDAVRTGTLAITIYHYADELQALRYSSLCEDLCELRRYKESAEAAQKAIALYRNLAMKDPNRWMCNLSTASSTLAHCLAASGNYSEALLVWAESLRILDNFLTAKQKPDSFITSRYLITLEIHTFISYVIKDENQCLKISHTASIYLRRLSQIYPKDEFLIQQLLWAEYRYAYNALRVGRLHCAQRCIEHSIDAWSSKPESILDFEFDDWHAGMITLKADVLDALGCTEQALLATEGEYDHMKPDSESDQPSGKVVLIMHKARLHANLGHCEEALHVAEAALQHSRDDKTQLIGHTQGIGFLLSLYTVAYTALSCQNYQRALESAREGCGFYANLPTWQINHLEREYHAFIRPNLYAFLSFAEANLGRLDNALKYANQAVYLSLDIANMRLHVSATTAERSYIETRGYLADILLATGNIPQAREICEERRTHFSKQVEKRMGDYRELAPILRMLGVLYCSEGRHEEGQGTTQELSQIMKMLGTAFPSLQEQVKIRLRRQAKVPILQIVEDMCQKLDCTHQMEVATLSEI